MSEVAKGSAVSIVGIVLYISFSFLLSFTIERYTSDLWTGLGLLFILWFVGAGIVVLVIVFSIYHYMKHQSQYSLGVLYGIVALTVFGLITAFLENIVRW